MAVAQTRDLFPFSCDNQCIMEQSTTTQAAYRRIYNVLKAQILSGEYPEGEQIPTEQEICTRFEVSRITARHSLRLLQDEGLVVRSAGRGTFVRTTAPHKIPIVEGDYIRSVHRDAPNLFRKLVRRERTEPPRQVKDTLGLLDTEECEVFERVDIIDDVPIAYDRVYLPCRFSMEYEQELLTAIDFLPRWLATEGFQRSTIREVTEAVRPDEHSIRLLEIVPEQPLLLTTDIITSERGTPLMLVETFYRGDRIQLVSTGTAESILEHRHE